MILVLPRMQTGGKERSAKLSEAAGGMRAAADADKRRCRRLEVSGVHAWIQSVPGVHSTVLL